MNNDQTKPPYSEARFDTNFEYNPFGQSGEKLYKFYFAPSGDLVFEYTITDKFEAMAFACRTWGKAAGAWGATRGSISNSLNLSDPAFDLPGEESGFGDEHSAEFDFRIQQLGLFYDALVDELEVQRNHP